MSTTAAEEQVDYEDAGAGVGSVGDSDVDENDQQLVESRSQNGDDDDNNDKNDHEDSNHNRRSRNGDENGGDGGNIRRIYRENHDDDNELSAEDISNIRDKRRLGNSQGIVEHVLFISRFVATTTKAEIRDLFSPFGKLGDINIMVNIAFIDFANADDASRAKHALHHQPGLGADSLIVDFKKLPGAAGSGGSGRSDRNGVYASSSRGHQNEYRGAGSYDSHNSGGYAYASRGREDEYDSRRPTYSATGSGYSRGSVSDESYRAGAGGSRDEYRGSRSSAPPQREMYRDEYVSQQQRVPIRREEHHVDPYQRGAPVVRGEPSRGYADSRGDYLPAAAAAGYRGAPVQSHDLRDEVRRYISAGGSNTRSRSRSRERAVDRGGERRGYPSVGASALVSGYERDGSSYRGGGGGSVRDRGDAYPSADADYGYGGGVDNTRRPISRGAPPPQYESAASYSRDDRDSRDRDPREGGRGGYSAAGGNMRGGGRGPSRSSRPPPAIAVTASGGEIAAFPNAHYPPKHAHHQINSLKRERE